MSNTAYRIFGTTALAISLFFTAADSQAQQQTGRSRFDVTNYRIEAQLIPDELRSAYQFRVQSRGESDLMGPRIVGAYDLGTRKVEARLHNFEFDRDMRTMLPEEQVEERLALLARIRALLLGLIRALRDAKESSARFER